MGSLLREPPMSPAPCRRGTIAPMNKILIALLAAMALPAAAAFKCTDEKGKAHYQDTPPPECANVVIYEVSASGSVVRKIEPNRAPPPAEPRKVENDRAKLDRERRDRTLLDTYGSEKEIDAARDRSLELIKARRTSAEKQLELVTKRRKQVESNKSASKADLDAVAKEEAGIRHAIAGYDAELEAAQKQFETDKVRWRELKEAKAR